MSIATELATNFSNNMRDWSSFHGIHICHKEIDSTLTEKASKWISFNDHSGFIKIFDETSSPYIEDFELGETVKDVVIGGLALTIPIAGPWICAGIVGLRGSRIFEKATTWINSYIFLFDNESEEYVFGMEIHYPKEKSIKSLMWKIENLVDEYNSEYEENDEDSYK
jgi:hypothetical protein